MALLDENFRCLGASTSYCVTLRLERTSIIGKTHAMLFPESAEAWERAERLCMDGSASTVEGNIPPDWSRKTAPRSWRLHPWKKSSNSIGGVFVFLQEDAAGQRDSLPAAFGGTQEQSPIGQSQSDQKLQAVCSIAGRIAHDLNNTLMVLNGYSTFLTEELITDERLRSKARIVLRTGERTARLVQELLALSRI